MGKNTHHDGPMRTKFAHIPTVTGRPVRTTFAQIAGTGAADDHSQYVGTQRLTSTASMRATRRANREAVRIRPAVVRICPVVRIGAVARTGWPKNEGR